MVKYKKRKLDYLIVFFNLLLFLVFLCFSKLEKQVFPYSFAVYIGSMSVNFSPIASSIMLIVNFLVLGKSGLILPTIIICAFYLILHYIYRKSKANKGFIYCAFSVFPLIAYLILGDYGAYYTIQRRIIVCAIIILLSLVTSSTLNCITKKGLKYKYTFDELLCLSVFTIAFGLGVCNFISPYLWKGLSALVILISCFLFNQKIVCLISSILGVCLSIYFGNISLISLLFIWGFIASCFNNINRYLSGLSLIAVDFIIQLVFSVYPVYSLKEILCLIIGVCVYFIIPTRPLNLLKEKIVFYKDKQLVRQTINRNKTMLSNRLYELSGVFTEMHNAFTNLQKQEMSVENAKNIIAKQTLSSVCEKCDKNSICIKNKNTRAECLLKMVDVGFAKGRLTLIDMPKAIGDLCIRPSEILYSLNKLLAEFRSYTLDRKNSGISRELLSEQSEGVAQILSGLALECGTTLSFQTKYENLLSEQLQKSGFIVSELLIYGEKENLSVSMILNMEEFSLTSLQNVLSKTIGVNMTLVDKANISQNKSYLVFCKECPYDAVFGVAKVTKQNSSASGDTHSVTKISEDKFLVALSDGMGSGESALNISSTALSLIESFYKAGLSSNLILSTVNKLLAINSEDNFTALDISVIDLQTCGADFIKYGCPYGFIISDKGIKIIEGNSLPMGILDSLKPSVCHTELSNDNMVVLMTDGVSDAFGSSLEVIDYIRTLPALNPQNFADKLLEKAISLNKEQPKDDMTVLAVRIFSKHTA